MSPVKTPLTETTSAQRNLAARQNADGGWPYARGVSWTEPTAYAVLALLASGDLEPARRGLHWLQAAQRPDGGWPPEPAVDQSTWVTALVACLPPEQLGAQAHARAIRWIAGSAGEESGTIFRIREWLLGHAPLSAREAPGWPWVPGTAAWVAPTSAAILALRAEVRRNPNPHFQARLEEGRQFLLQRMCHGGGWNHGSNQALGYPTTPYPETTGLALLALGGVRAPQIDRSLPLAAKFAQQCRSADAWNWLRLGLHAQGRFDPSAMPAANLPLRTVPEIALDWIARSALEGRDRILG